MALLECDLRQPPLAEAFYHAEGYRVSDERNPLVHIVRAVAAPDLERVVDGCDKAVDEFVVGASKCALFDRDSFFGIQAGPLKRCFINAAPKPIITSAEVVSVRLERHLLENWRRKDPQIIPSVIRDLSSILKKNIDRALVVIYYDSLTAPRSELKRNRLLYIDWDDLKELNERKKARQHFVDEYSEAEVRNALNSALLLYARFRPSRTIVEKYLTCKRLEFSALNPDLKAALQIDASLPDVKRDVVAASIGSQFETTIASYVSRAAKQNNEVVVFKDGRFVESLAPRLNDSLSLPELYRDEIIDKLGKEYLDYVKAIGERVFFECRLQRDDTTGDLIGCLL